MNLLKFFLSNFFYYFHVHYPIVLKFEYIIQITLNIIHTKNELETLEIFLVFFDLKES